MGFDHLPDSYQFSPMAYHLQSLRSPIQIHLSYHRCTFCAVLMIKTFPFLYVNTKLTKHGLIIIPLPLMSYYPTSMQKELPQFLPIITCFSLITAYFSLYIAYFSLINTVKQL